MKRMLVRQLHRGRQISQSGGDYRAWSGRCLSLTSGHWTCGCSTWKMAGGRPTRLRSHRAPDLGPQRPMPGQPRSGPIGRDPPEKPTPL
jgi:hypothetical protein